MQYIPFEVCGSNLSKAVKSLSALSSAILLTNQTNPLPPSLCLRARSSRLKSTRFHVDGGGRRREGHYDAAQEREVRVCRVRTDEPRTGSSDKTT